MLLRKLLGSVAFGVGVTVLALIIGSASRGLRPLGDLMLAPGYWLPEAYWGGVHDPMQILIAISLNVSFYALVALAAMTFRAKWHLWS